MKFNYNNLTPLTKLSLLLSLPFFLLILGYFISYTLESVSDYYSGENSPFILLWIFFIPTIISSPLALALGLVSFTRTLKSQISSHEEKLISSVALILGIGGAVSIVWYLV